MLRNRKNGGGGHCAQPLEGRDWPKAPDHGSVGSMNPGGSEGNPISPWIFGPRFQKPAAEKGPDIWILTPTPAWSYCRLISGPDVSVGQLA